jgi:hypothetical protein
MGARLAGKRPGRAGPPEAGGVPARQRSVKVVVRPARTVIDTTGDRRVQPRSLRLASVAVGGGPLLL